MTPENLSRLTTILEMDFDDLTSGDIQFLRNRIREAYKVDPTVKLDKEKCYTAFCLFKRKYIPRLEILFIQPKVLKKNGGIFGLNLSRRQSVPVSQWDGFNKDHKGVYHVQSGYFPVISVRYLSTHTEVTCMSVHGYFFEVDSRIFDFDI